MRILVTGSSGFIGRHLCAALVSAGHEVMGLSRSTSSEKILKSKSFSQIAYNLGDSLPIEVLHFSPTVLINLAWSGIPNFSPDQCIKNLQQHISFIERLEELKGLQKIIGAGSCKEYGAMVGSCKETAGLRPLDYFAWSKLSLLDYLTFVCGRRNMTWIWLRFFYVYGPGQRSNSLIPMLFRSLSKGDKPNILDLDGANDYIYVDDVVSGIVAAINTQGIQGVFNIGSGNLTSTRTIVSMVKDILIGDFESAKLTSEDTNNSIFHRGFYASLDKVSSGLNWSPQVTLMQGIKKYAILKHCE